MKYKEKMDAFLSIYFLQERLCSGEHDDARTLNIKVKQEGGPKLTVRWRGYVLARTTQTPPFHHSQTPPPSRGYGRKA